MQEWTEFDVYLRPTEVEAMLRIEAAARCHALSERQRALIYWDRLYLEHVAHARTDKMTYHRARWLSAHTGIPTSRIKARLRHIDRMLSAANLAEIELDFSYQPDVSDETTRLLVLELLLVAVEQPLPGAVETPFHLA